MKSILKANSVFFFLIAILTLVGGICLNDYEKTDLIYYFSANRSAFADQFFTYFTKLGEWPVYIVAGLGFLAFKLRHSILIGLIGLLVTGLSFSLKSYFAIDRPIAFLRKQNLLDQVNLVAGIDLHSGATSFPSGHSMSAFAFYCLLILLLPTKKRYVIPLLLTAIGVAISRVYLVQHFYSDIYIGGLIGVSVAIFVYSLDQKVKLDKNHFLERPVLKR